MAVERAGLPVLLVGTGEELHALASVLPSSMHVVTAPDSASAVAQLRTLDDVLAVVVQLDWMSQEKVFDAATERFGDVSTLVLPADASTDSVAAAGQRIEFLSGERSKRWLLSQLTPMLAPVVSRVDIEPVEVRALQALPERQRQVLLLSCQGLAGRAVAERLQLSPSTVQTHKQRVADALGYATFGQAVLSTSKLLSELAGAPKETRSSRIRMRPVARRQGDTEGEAVLVLDDVVTVCRKHAALAEAQWPGCEVITAASVSEALARTDGRRVHAALCDLQLPDGSGFSVMKRLSEQNPALAPMVVTGYPLPHAIEEALAGGVALFAAKPLLPEAVAAYDQILHRVAAGRPLPDMPTILGMSDVVHQVLFDVCSQTAERWRLQPDDTEAMYTLLAKPGTATSPPLRARLTKHAREHGNHETLEAALLSLQLVAMGRVGEAMASIERGGRTLSTGRGRGSLLAQILERRRETPAEPASRRALSFVQRSDDSSDEATG